MEFRLLVLILILLAPSHAAQDSKYGDSFTMTVVKPTLPKDVQMRFMFYGREFTLKGIRQPQPAMLYLNEYPFQGSRSWKPADGNRIEMLTGPEPVPAKSFKLIAYAPGCQFVTVSVDDLAFSNRQGEFECRRLSSIEFHGRADISDFVGKALQVEAFYGRDLGAAFFGKNTPVKPFSLGKVDVASDGSFTINLPDLVADPLWYTIEDDSNLYFALIDGANGQHLGTMGPSSDTRGGPLKVAPSYPEVDFNVHPDVQRR